jgi:hypothetical protein
LPELGTHRKTAGEATAASCTIAIDDSDSTAGSILRLFSLELKGLSHHHAPRNWQIGGCWGPGSLELQPSTLLNLWERARRAAGGWKFGATEHQLHSSRVLGAQLRNRDERALHLVLGPWTVETWRGRSPPIFRRAVWGSESRPGASRCQPTALSLSNPKPVIGPTSNQNSEHLLTPLRHA